MESTAEPSVPTHHVVITGTGRAGTTFLVRFLAACGLDAGDLEEIPWWAPARAGLERSLTAPSVPYLVKDPGFSEYCHTLDPAHVVIDALIVPVRDLLQAAASRVTLERKHLLAVEDLPAEPAILTGRTPGGMVFSLDLFDQARLLGFLLGRLLAWAVQRQVPLYLLDFPRLVHDGGYLVDELEPLLPCTRARALEVFEELADPALVGTYEQPADDAHSAWRAERAALFHVLDDQKHRIAELETQLHELRADHHRLRGELELSQEVAFSLRRENEHLRGVIDGLRAAGEVP